MRAQRGTVLESYRNLRAQLAEQLRVHAQVCSTCVSLTQTANRYCDEGWQLVREHHRASRQVEHLEQVQGTDQPGLF